MSSVAWTWRTNAHAMWHMSSLSWRIASYMRKNKEFFCSLHHFLVYIFTGSIEPLETFLTNFGAMHLYLYSAYSYSIQSHLYSKLLYILQNLMHTLARPPIFGQICCIFWSRPILPRQAGLNSAGFGSHDSRSEVRDGVQPFMGSPIFPHNLFDWKYDSRILTSNLHVYM